MQELWLPLLIALVILAVFVWLIDELRKHPSLLRQIELEMHEGGWVGRRLGRAARFRLPVYSAETVQGREAEFIRDRLPIRVTPTLLIMLALLALVLALFSWVMP